MEMNLSNINLEKLLTECTNISRNAGEILLKYFNAPMKVDFKGRYNMVTEADIQSEKYIIDKLTELTPDISVLSEEDSEKNTSSATDESRILWIVDPLDGTTNFTHGYPHFCISIALVMDNNPVLGIIYDPCRDELFHASAQSGVFCNGNPCQVSGNSRLETSVIATGFPYKVRELKKNNLIEFCALRLNTQGVRRFGAAALDLAYVAAGRLDGFWERWLKPWDTAAGILMVREAGGKVTRFNGKKYSLFEPEILATNQYIHDEMSHILTSNLPELPEIPI